MLNVGDDHIGVGRSGDDVGEHPDDRHEHDEEEPHRLGDTVVVRAPEVVDEAQITMKIHKTNSANMKMLQNTESNG